MELFWMWALISLFCLLSLLNCSFNKATWKFTFKSYFLTYILLKTCILKCILIAFWRRLASRFRIRGSQQCYVNHVYLDVSPAEINGSKVRIIARILLSIFVQKVFIGSVHIRGHIKFWGTKNGMMFMKKKAKLYFDHITDFCIQKSQCM